MCNGTLTSTPQGRIYTNPNTDLLGMGMNTVLEANIRETFPFLHLHPSLYKVRNLVK